MDERIEVRPSSIHGLGLFARAAMAAGEVVIILSGEELPISRLHELKARPRYDCAALSPDTILVFTSDDPVTRGNHSCDPNLWMVGHRSISVRRSVSAGEELTIDYATHSDDADWSMECRCGSPRCRGVVTGQDWRLAELHEQYCQHFSPYLSRK